MIFLVIFNFGFNYLIIVEYDLVVFYHRIGLVIKQVINRLGGPAFV